MKFSRRDFVHAGCTIAGATLVPHFMDRAEAGLRLHGSASLSPSGISQRNVININVLQAGTNDYALIDHIKNSQVSPFGGFASGLTFPAAIDADGWPNVSGASGQNWGYNVDVPDPNNYGGTGLSNGTYIIDLEGNGSTLFNGFGATVTFSVVTTNNCTATPSANTLTIVSSGGASKASVEFTFASSISGPISFQWRVGATGTGGFFVKNVRFYRSVDNSDLNNGLIWRGPWKQSLVNLDPSVIRFMNVLGGNNNRHCRFENRCLPTYAGWGAHSLWNASPIYAVATGTNQYSVAAAPTTANPKTPTTNMLHGEVCTARFASGFARTGTGAVAISNITNTNPGVVTTTAPHGYNTGDVIGHYMPQSPIDTGGTLNGTTLVSSITTTNIVAGLWVFGTGIPANTTVVSVNAGLSQITLSNAAILSMVSELQFRSMQPLHQYPCTITLDPVTPATKYSIGIDTTSFGAFLATGTPHAYQFITLAAGSGGDRGGIAGSPVTGYPCTFGDGNLPASWFGPYMNSNDYKTWYFDKTTSAQTDGSGNPVLGVWKFSTTPNVSIVGFGSDYPIEVCVALVNELNAMSPAHTIGMWMNIPVWGLSSMDPDYSTSSDWAVNAVDVVMNPSSSVRTTGYSALGYSGATQLNQPNLIIELSNELWPSGTNTDGTGWLANRSNLRWPTSGTWNNNGDYMDMKALRSTLFTRAIKASNPPGLSRIKFVIGVQGTQGLSPGSGNRGYETVFGGNVTATPKFTGDWYTNDILVTGGSWGRPIDNHDGVCIAPYFDGPSAYWSSTSGTGNFTDDSAMYNGVDNSGTGLSFTGGTGGVSSTTLTTATFPTGSPVLHQPIVGAGITNPTTIEGISGTSPTFTLTLSRAASVTNGTTITSPANGGGNYIGAANQALACSNFASKIEDVGSTASETPNRYATFIGPQISAVLPPGKVGICYEGAHDWPTTVGSSWFSHSSFTNGDSLFAIGVIGSAGWAAVQKRFMDNWCAISANMFMPSVYIWNTGGAGNQRWAYCNPDTYALNGGVPTEGQALLNSATWVALSARNVALPN